MHLKSVANGDVRNGSALQYSNTDKLDGVFVTDGVDRIFVNITDGSSKNPHISVACRKSQAARKIKKHSTSIATITITLMLTALVLGATGVMLGHPGLRHWTFSKLS